MTLDQLNALNRFALKHGRAWRVALQLLWLTDQRTLGDPNELALLRQLRNSGGPLLFKRFTPREGGFVGVASLKATQVEHRTARTARMRTAWMLINDQGIDLVQPWATTKAEARNVAQHLGYFLTDNI